MQPIQGDSMKLIQFKILNTAIERTLNNELAELGLTYTQATVIGFLKQNANKEICQRDIEYNLGLTHPTVSSILNRMEESKLIVTAPQQFDHRYKNIVLTEKALEVSSRVHKKIEKITNKMTAGITSEQNEMLSEILSKLIANINS